MRDPAQLFEIFRHKAGPGPFAVYNCKFFLKPYDLVERESNLSLSLDLPRPVSIESFGGEIGCKE